MCNVLGLRFQKYLGITTIVDVVGHLFAARVAKFKLDPSLSFRFFLKPLFLLYFSLHSLEGPSFALLPNVLVTFFRIGPIDSLIRHFLILPKSQHQVQLI